MAELTLEDLKQDVFADVQAKRGMLILTFRVIGQRYAITVDDGLARSSEYGEELTINIGHRARITSRNQTITVEPLPNNFRGYGFHIITKTEMRMHGKGIMTKEAYALLIPDTATPDDVFLTPIEFWFIKADLKELMEAIKSQ